MRTDPSLVGDALTGPNSHSTHQGWEHTTLWKLISNNTTTLGIDLHGTLTKCMPRIQLILSKGGTAATDFTLHDDGHAFRVAERMCKIISTDVLEQLSLYELAFLLLSAYLHDIGMTPELKRVRRHYYYLQTGEREMLSEGEAREFQKWLDDDGRGITPPISKAQPTSKDLQLCQEIVTHYARARHNDWGAEWIKQNLDQFRLGQYKHWIEDIIKLCRSHHVGYNELKDPSFDPIIVNPDEIIVHLRFLACTLRIADILEFDPERTPNVIFDHRDVSPDSRIYWWKDHDVTLVLEGGNLKVHARPSNASTERAIHLMMEAINTELQLCRALDEQTHFEVCPSLSRKLPHKWSLSSTASISIFPKEGAYEYINGAFRPNTRKMLQLLSGTALYGEPLVAIRELLQNSFDAVREKIAYLWLNQSTHDDAKLTEQLASLHAVTLRLEIDNEDAWLVCTDNGIGMTRSIIENHLLISGASSRHDVLELERRCLEKGFRLGRTGQFGIGVLSYFMICDRLIIETKRSQEPGDGEATGWRFETGGVGSFGELRKQTSLPPGTTVRLHLRNDIIGTQPYKWFETAVSFVRRTLCRIPCRFEMASDHSLNAKLSLSPGWCRTQDSFAEELLGEITWNKYQNDNETPRNILSSARRQQIQNQDNYIADLRNEARECLRWKTFEREIPNGTGIVRVHIPYFDLLDNGALAFLRVVNRDGHLIIKRIREGFMFLPKGRVQESWKGMAIASRRVRIDMAQWNFDRETMRAFVEIDWASPKVGEIAVNRKQLHANHQSKKYQGWIYRQVKRLKEGFAKSLKESAFEALNTKLVDSENDFMTPLNWLALARSNRGKERQWKRLNFPLVSCNSFAFSGLPSRITWNGSNVSVSGNIQEMHDDVEFYEGVPWYSKNSPPDKVVLVENYYPQLKGHVKQRRRFIMPSIKMIPLWTTNRKLSANIQFLGMTSKFPAVWPMLCCTKFTSDWEYLGDTHIWNRDHLLISSLDSEGQDWCKGNFSKSLDPIPLKREILLEKRRAIGWVLMCLKSESRDLWEGLKDRDQTFLRDLWAVIFSGRDGSRSKDPAICMWVEEEYDSKLCILTPSAWLEVDEANNRKIKKYLPDPGPEGKVLIHHPQSFGRTTAL